MSDKSNQKGESVAEQLCTAPSLGALVPAYLVDVLDEHVEEAVEQHLIACDDCHARYMTIIQVRHQGKQARWRANQKKQTASSERSEFRDAKPDS